mmetsp:Transcript_34205/g.80573  ORF Transcript_34205/g.80573 Transcript_34205/m.80573 type:complete len:127 (+) Transcript_34205:175-555(+)
MRCVSYSGILWDPSTSRTIGSEHSGAFVCIATAASLERKDVTSGGQRQSRSNRNIHRIAFLREIVREQIHHRLRGSSRLSYSRIVDRAIVPVSIRKTYKCILDPSWMQSHFTGLRFQESFNWCLNP